MKYKIEESSHDYMTTVDVGRKIKHGRDETVLRLEFDDKDQIIGLFMKFNGSVTSTMSQETIEELRRFKALLNSFEEL